MWPVPTFSNSEASLGVSLHSFPRMDEIPKEFHNYHSNKFCKIASNLFFNGGKIQDHNLSPRKDVDRIQAFRAISGLLRSFSPQHEHKMSAVGFLLDQWYEPFVMEHESPHKKSNSNHN